MPHHGLTFCEWTPQSWSEAREISSTLGAWVFRGQANAEWKLENTLERAARAAERDIWEIPEIEKRIIGSFQRRAQQYLSVVPAHDQLFEWLSLLQHHGGPTRLLDFSHSFYIASFFALETTLTEAAVFCLNEPLLQAAAVERESDRHPPIEHFIGSPDYCDSAISEGVRSPLVLISEPFVMNERLAAQQGLFGLPFEVQQSFEYNLSLTIDPFEKHLPETTRIEGKVDFEKIIEKCALLKIRIPRRLQAEAKKDLASMNINAATLFPGLDGFARSLVSAFEF